MDNPASRPLQTTPKVFDVSRPGKVPPSATSRPVIVGQNPPVHDSTLTEKPPAEPARHDHQLMSPHEKITIQPPADTEAVQESAPATGVPDQQQSPREAGLTPPIAENEPPTAPNSQPPEKSQITDYAVSSNGPLSPESVATVDPAQIVVSHHAAVAKRRWLKIFFITLLVLVVMAVALDIILDASVWKPGFNIPHTHFLK